MNWKVKFNNRDEIKPKLMISGGLISEEMVLYSVTEKVVCNKVGN